MKYTQIYKLLIIISLVLSGCIPYPSQVVAPLKTQIIDSISGKPISHAMVLRIVCDVHDFSCNNAKIFWGTSNNNGLIEMEGERKWGLVFPAPGGMPLPNHRIAIWKAGYKAFVFSQYGTIDDFLISTKRTDLIEAIRLIPKERIQYTVQDNPEKLFISGVVRLQPLM